MNNFESSDNGYKKKEVNEFVDYVIKKTEENITIIKTQRDEIYKLQEELQKHRELEKSYNGINQQNEKLFYENKRLAEKEANLIIQSAKDNASKIVNDALIKSQRIENDRTLLNNNIKVYKKKIRNTLMEQLDMIEDIEVL